MYPSYDMLLLREKLLNEIQTKKRKAKEVAELLNVKRETVSRWLARYRFEGLDGIWMPPTYKMAMTLADRFMLLKLCQSAMKKAPPLRTGPL